MISMTTIASYYGLPLNAPEDFVQGYADGMRLDAKGQGKPCGRGFIAPGKKCSSKGRQQLASDLKAGDAKAKARVATGKRNAQNQQAERRKERLTAYAEETRRQWNERQAPKTKPAETKRKRSPETIENQQATRRATQQQSSAKKERPTKTSQALKEGYTKAGGLGRQRGSGLRKNQFSTETRIALKGGHATYKGGSSPSDRVRWGNR